MVFLIFGVFRAVGFGGVSGSIVLYVNNILIISKDKAKIKTLKKSLIRRFKIEGLGPIEYFIGVKIT